MRASNIITGAIWIGMAALPAAGISAVVDRIAVVVGKNVITETEVLQEVRLTGFLNRQPVGLGPEERRAAAERLVDQQLIRNEMEIGGYPAPSREEAAAMLRKFREENYGSDAKLREALARYGITEDQLQQHFLWELAIMRFTDQRFAVGLAAARNSAAPGLSAGSALASVPDQNPQAPVASTAGTANRAAPAMEEAPLPAGVDQQLESWLKQKRNGTRVRFKKEAFE